MNTEIVIEKIKNIVKSNGELDMDTFDVEILLHRLCGCDLSKYNYKKVAEMGCIALNGGKKIVEILEDGCIVESGDDIMVMNYSELSDIVLCKILSYLVMAV